MKDTIGNPLENVSVIARDEIENKKPSFSISDEKGNFKLLLNHDVHYIITVSHLGFKKHIFYSNNRDEHIDILLQEEPEKLKEVNIVIPVVFKKDTIIYNPDSFTSGEERKLKDVLKKLPGVEVDQDGIVTVQGQKIDKMLVEGKEFFGGNSHLAVENIPADAINRVEVYDNYQKINFLKDFDDSGTLAMNIKLNPDKKKLLFGSLTAGYGLENRYLTHTNSFFYTPKTAVNVIGNINNSGYIPFTFKDYMFYEGGISKVLDKSKNFFKNFENSFSNLSENNNIKDNLSKFASINLTSNITPKFEIGTYYITNAEQINKKEVIINDFFTDNNFLFSETINNAESTRSFKNIGKISLSYSSNSFERIDYDIFTKSNHNEKGAILSTLLLNSKKNFENKTDNKNITIDQTLEWKKKLSSKHLLFFSINHFINKNDENSSWNSNEKLLSGIIELSNDLKYSVLQEKPYKNESLNFLVKDFLIVNNLFHLNTSLGYTNNLQNFDTHNWQFLSTNDSINLNQFGFYNSIKTQLHDFYIGIQFKIKMGKTTITPGVFSHYYKQHKSNNNKTLFLLPQLEITKDIKKSEKLSFKYQLKNHFFDASNFARNYYLDDYNSIIKAEINNYQALTHFALLYYSKFSMFRNLMFRTSLNIRFTNKNLVSEKTYIESNQISTYMLAQNPSWNSQFQMEFRKGIGNYNFQIKTNLLYSEPLYVFDKQLYISNNFTQDYKFKIRTNFVEYPNIDVGFDKNIFKAKHLENSFIINSPFIELTFKPLKNWLFKSEYKFNEVIFRDKKIRDFSNLNFNLGFTKENSAIGFEVDAKNVLNSEFIYTSYGFDNLITNTKKSVFPRVIMLNLSYKF